MESECHENFNKSFISYKFLLIQVSVKHAKEAVILVLK